MKKTLLHAALLALITPISSIYGLGLGKMTVKSALDQPFLAEIELVDARSVAIKDVKVNLADPENFEEIGLERAPVLSLLSFKIEKNEQGKEVIKVESTERMSEPYMELVVDLIWPEGQLYKAYTILLDPPGYHLVSSTIQGGTSHYKYHQQHISEPGVIDKTVVTTTVNHNPITMKDSRKKSSYGPTVTNDSIWQIAQRYKSSEIILPQVVLAIVGANPDAFSHGNLNGLKVGVRLTIPATSDIALVPGDLATAEVMAHDKAWNDKQPIEHVLTPPYTNSNQNITSKTTPLSSSAPSTTVPPIPTPNDLPLIPTNTSSPLTSNPLPVATAKPQNIEQDATTKTEISLTIAAVESVREANALLMEQLHLLQKQNDKLQKQLDQRNKELKQLKTQIKVLVKQRQSLPSQASTSETESSTSIWPLILLLFAATGGAGFAFWYLRGRKQKNPTSVSTPSSDDNSLFIKPREEKAQVIVQTEDTPKTELMIVEQKQTPIEEPVVQPPAEKESTEEIQKMDLNTNTEQEQSFEDKSQFEHVESDNNETPVETVEVHDESLAFKADSISEQSSDVKETIETPEEENELLPLEFTKDFSSTKPEEYSTESKDVPEHSLTEEEFLEFESGLHQTLKPSPTVSTEKKEQDTSEGIDFVPSENLTKTKDENYVEDFFVEKEVSKNETPQKEEKPIDVDDSLSQFFVEDKESNAEDKESNAEDKESNAEDKESNVEDKESNKEEEFDSGIEAELKKDRLKSKKALETLLALAKTYVSMDDFESARHSLEEVVEHGSQKQKDEAAILLESIKGK